MGWQRRVFLRRAASAERRDDPREGPFHCGIDSVVRGRNARFGPHRHPASRFKHRMQWFIENRPELSQHVETQTYEGGVRRFLSLVNRHRLRSVMRYLLDEKEFLSPCGIRALSRYHRDHPYVLNVMGHEHRVDYEPAESSTPQFGGNSNWRGPIWFPVNYLLIESLQKFHFFLGDHYKVEYPFGSGQQCTLWQVAESSLGVSSVFSFAMPEESGPVFGGAQLFSRIPIGRTICCFMTTSMEITGAVLAPATRPAGRDSSRSLSSSRENCGSLNFPQRPLLLHRCLPWSYTGVTLRISQFVDL